MKAFGLLILLFSSLSLAAVNKSANTPFVEKTYACAQYTDNDFNNQTGFTSDNDAVYATTVIHQKDTEFTIEKNTIWKDGATMANLSGDSRLNQGSNTESLFFKKHTLDGTPYFMAIFFGETGAYRAVVLGQCVRK